MAGHDSVIEGLTRAVQQIGPYFNPEVLRQTRDIYRPHIAATDASIRVDRDLAYGPHARHRLDLYRCGTDIRPLLVFIHGGGFVAGSKDEDGTFHRNVGEYFARHGYVTLVPNYRLAPAERWPAGAQDVGRVLQWASAHAAEYGAHPHSIRVIGQSAGASHAATWLFDPQLACERGPDVSAIVLMAGFYSAQDPLSLPIRSYFGEDVNTYAARSPVSHVSAAGPRVLLTIAEFDPGPMARQTYLMAAALSQARGASARLRWFAGHNHVSTVQSLGSPQDDVGQALRVFLQA